MAGTALLSRDQSCFSESYADAREKFRNAATAVGAELHSMEVARDAVGEYTMDVAIVKGGPRLLVVSSGTHGVEGYAGSAIQISLLRQFADRGMVGPTIVMVHAVNPFGMAHFRRWNENNVDLNRNALLPHHFQALVSKDKLQATYNNFEPLFNPTSPPGCFYIKIGIWIVSLCSIIRYGMLSLKTALVAATYSSRKGVFYGGQELQPSHAILRDFMTKHFSHVPASEVGWIDVHTGLGPCGVDVILGSCKDKEEFQKAFPKVPGESDGFQGPRGRNTDDLVKERCEGPALPVGGSGPVTQSAGYELTVGVLGRDEWLNQFFKPQSGRVRSFTQEIGTLSNVRVARALMLENVGFHYDRENHEYWRTFTRDAFYVRTADWKARVLRRGHDVFHRMVALVAPA